MAWSEYWKRIGDARFEKEPFTWRFYEMLLGDYDFMGKKILEVGCGTGIDSIHMGRRGAKITFLDMSAEALRIARGNADRFNIEAEFLNGNVLDYNFGGEFDMAHSNGTVEHFTGGMRQKFIDIHRDAVKKGGKVVILVPNLKCVPYIVGKSISESIGVWPYGSEHPYTRKELKARLERAGLSVEKVIGGELLFSLFWLFCPIYLPHLKWVRKGILAKARPKWVRLNYNNPFANKWGRLIGAVATKV